MTREPEQTGTMEMQESKDAEKVEEDKEKTMHDHCLDMLNIMTEASIEEYEENPLLQYFATRFRLPANILTDAFNGDTALHLAVVNGDFPAVKMLVSKGADVNHRAIDQYFNHEYSKSVGVPEDKYRAFGYYGEYALSYAAVFGHETIYDYLLRQNADTNAQDSFGNTILHMVVIHNQVDMFSYAMRHPVKRANPWIKNNENLTAIALCAKLGLHEMFDEIMELARVEVWSFSTLSCSLYPLPSLDTIGEDGTIDEHSALFQMVSGESVGHLEMLHHVVIQQLIAEKWKVFAKKRFLQRLVLFIGHLICMSAVVYLRRRPTEFTDDSSIGWKDARDTGRYICEIIIFLGSCSTFLMHVEEVKNMGFIKFVKNMKTQPSKPLMLLSTLLILMILPLRIAMWVNFAVGGYDAIYHYLVVEEAFVAVMVPLGWTFSLFFLKIHHLFGPLIITLYLMIAKDVVKVMIIFTMFWFMFATAFTVLYKDTGYEGAKDLPTAILSVYQMNFGAFEYKDFETSKLPEITSVLFFLTMLTMPILLLNMLIATMGNTFQMVITRAKQEWFSQYAKTVLTLERAFKKDALKGFQNRYTEQMSRNTRDARYISGNQGYLKDRDEGFSVAGVRLTKKMPLTRATVKRTAHTNWKWLYGTLRELIKLRRKTIKDRRVTFWDLFGSDDLLEGDYAKEKLLADNLRHTSLQGIFNRTNAKADISNVAQAALFSMVPQINSMNMQQNGNPQHSNTAEQTGSIAE